MNETLTLRLILLNGGYDVAFAGGISPSAVLSPSSAHGAVLEP